MNNYGRWYYIEILAMWHGFNSDQLKLMTDEQLKTTMDEVDNEENEQEG